MEQIINNNNQIMQPILPPPLPPTFKINKKFKTVVKKKIVKPKIIVPKDFKPTLYDVHKSFEVIKIGKHNGIMGEHRNRLSFYTANIISGIPTIVRGQRGTGKSGIIDIGSTFMKHPVELEDGSDKANVYDSDELNKASHFIVAEINKINARTIEMLKNWGEDKPYKYKTLVKNKDTDEQEKREFFLEPSPFVTNLADENKAKLGEEMISRCIVLYTNASEDLNRKVMAKKGKARQDPYKKQAIEPKQVKYLQEYTKQLPSIKDYVFVNPAGGIIQKNIPSLFSDARRDIDKYMDNTEGICLFHYHDRIETNLHKEKQLYITPADMLLNHIIFGQLVINSSLKLSKIEKLILKMLLDESKLVTDIEDTNIREGKLSITDIMVMIRKKGFAPTQQALNKFLKELVNNGYVGATEGKTTYYEISTMFKKHVNNVDWKIVIDFCKESIKKNFPDIAEEYCTRFCDNPTCVNPFNGTIINILEYKNEQDFFESKDLKDIEIKTISEQPSLDKFNEPVPTKQPQISGKSKPFTKENLIATLTANTAYSMEQLINCGGNEELVEKCLKTGLLFEQTPDRYMMI